MLKIVLFSVEKRELCLRLDEKCSVNFCRKTGAINMLVIVFFLGKKKRFSLTAAFWITRIKMDDVCLVIHYIRICG